MRHLLLLLLISAPGRATPPGAALIGPQPGVLDTALSHDSGADAAPFGRTPAGLCSEQALRAGIQLPERPELYGAWDRDRVWGTAEMIEAITRAAEEMAWLMPHADPIVIGDISRRYGGALAGHKSHRGGIDADIGIYTTGGRQPQGGGFTTVTPQNIDYEANWLFWRSLLDTGLVDRILLDQTLIDAMRAWTIQSGNLTVEEAHYIFAPAGTPQLWARTGVFQHAVNHHHHIHLRVRCGDPIQEDVN